MAHVFNDSNFDEDVLHSDKSVLVDFFAEWCGPCKMMAPVIDELAGEMEGEALVGKLNVDEAPQTAAKYGVQSIPTVIVFKDGKEVNRAVGFKSKEDLKALLG